MENNKMIEILFQEFMNEFHSDSTFRLSVIKELEKPIKAVFDQFVKEFHLKPDYQNPIIKEFEKPIKALFKKMINEIHSGQNDPIVKEFEKTYEAIMDELLKQLGSDQDFQKKIAGSVAKHQKAIAVRFVKQFKTNPGLQNRINKSIGEDLNLLIAFSPDQSRSKKNTRPKRDPARFDPRLIYKNHPEDLKPRLEDLTIDQLKDMAFEQGWNTDRTLMNSKNKTKIVESIINKVIKGADKGKLFLEDEKDGDPESGRT